MEDQTREQCFKGLRATYGLYNLFGRNSLDRKGATLSIKRARSLSLPFTSGLGTLVHIGLLTRCSLEMVALVAVLRCPVPKFRTTWSAGTVATIWIPLGMNLLMTWFRRVLALILTTVCRQARSTNQFLTAWV